MLQRLILLCIALAGLGPTWLLAGPERAATAGECPAVLQHQFQQLDSDQRIDLCEFAGRPVLVVNTASFCGYTGQFSGLEALFQRYGGQRYGDAGLAIVGVPSNDFNQEARDEAETADICYANYGVTFTMTAPQSVRGAAAHPLFRALARESGAPPRWNFHKYLIAPDGAVVGQFPSQIPPQDERITGLIEAHMPK
ncbi:glutathione peroxidase [Alcanivorax sp. JB21]|uniref:glutathione peroxidase n=1 Tax=Alcanivorax limicola TaxID=2874102 RepID=UPI001CBC031F|nr:glutathione peroxidase [Alcanivorax limicola]MBZ2188723.1 glutathione peroxidase [Alcanivorax limicola]